MGDCVCTVPQYLTEDGSGLQHSDEHAATLFKSGDYLSERGVASAELYAVTVLNTVELSKVHAGRKACLPDSQYPARCVLRIGLMITTGVTLNRCGAPTELAYCSAVQAQARFLSSSPATSKSNAIH